METLAPAFASGVSEWWRSLEFLSWLVKLRAVVSDGERES
jgi:hypothetical protein